MMEIESYTKGWNDAMDRALELIQDAIPYGEFGITQNVISVLDIYKLKAKVKGEMRDD